MGWKIKVRHGVKCRKEGNDETMNIPATTATRLWAICLTSTSVRASKYAIFLSARCCSASLTEAISRMYSSKGSCRSTGGWRG